MNGFLIFESFWGHGTQRIPVRACPDPAAVRAALEAHLGRPVRWERAR